MTPPDWEGARTVGLAAARLGTEETLRAALARQGKPAAGDEPLPLWWRSTLQKAQWSAGRCLEALADVAREGSAGAGGVWLSQNRRFHADVGTASGPLRLQAHCDLVFSDQPDLAGASCQLIDIRTGAAPAAGAQSAEPARKGARDLNLAALMFLAVQAGARARRHADRRRPSRRGQHRPADGGVPKDDALNPPSDASPSSSVPSTSASAVIPLHGRRPGARRRDAPARHGGDRARRAGGQVRAVPAAG